jgi:hypothetical protein
MILSTASLSSLAPRVHVLAAVLCCFRSAAPASGGPPSPRVQTAEMPDFYSPGEYDLSGFAVGSVKKAALVDGSSIQAGDVILGLPSSGVHSNGFSLVRRCAPLTSTGRLLSWLDPACLPPPWSAMPASQEFLSAQVSPCPLPSTEWRFPYSERCPAWCAQHMGRSVDRWHVRVG